MEFDTYVLECVVRDRLREARRAAADWRLFESLRGPRRPLRAAVGLAMIRLGHRVLGQSAQFASQPGALGGS